MKKTLKIIAFILFACVNMAQAKSTYSVNLMWLNARLNSQQKLVCPDNKLCVEQMREWAKKNPDAEINFWIDSATTTAKQVKKTRKLIEAKNTEDMAPIRLKDIRNLPGMSDKLAIFSDSRIPVYFRADLARAIVLHDLAFQEHSDDVVYADIDIPTMTKEQLFDEQTQEDLDRYGIVMAKYNSTFENGFQMVRSKNTDVLSAMKYALIDLSTQRVHNAYQGKFDHLDNRMPNWSFQPLAESVYSCYKPMFQYLYDSRAWGKMWVGYYEDSSQEYDKDKHGLKPFGLNSVAGKYLGFRPYAGYEKLYNKADHEVFIPTKDVNIPAPSSNYTQDIK